MWTIDVSVFGSNAWLRTAGRYDSADGAVGTLVRFARRDCYGRHMVYRARKVDELDAQLDTERQRARRAA